MRLISGYSFTLIAILLSKTWSLPDPTCYEPTSGHGPMLVGSACIGTGLEFLDRYPLDYYFYTHSTPRLSNIIQCPLKIEQQGCLFALDFTDGIAAIGLPRASIVDAILAIQIKCVGRDTNVDGGELVVSLTNEDQSYVKYSLQHPESRLFGNNTTSQPD